MMSRVTRRVLRDYGKLTEQQFFRKYACSKKRYAKRLYKYGDPYMNSPLVKIGKYLKRLGF